MNQGLVAYLDFAYVCKSSYSRYSGLIKNYLEHTKVIAKEVNVFCKRLVANKSITVHCTNIKEIPDFC